MPTKRNPSPTPFASDLEYLQEELHWIEARCRRIASSLRIQQLSTDEAPRRRHRHDDDDDPRMLDVRQRQAALDERRLRGEIDARLAAPGAAPTALDRLTALHGLDEFERTLVLLSAAPAFSRSFETLYGPLASDGIGMSSLTVEVAFAFAELPFAERIRRRATFSKTAPLFANDVLVFSQLGRCTSPEELLSADVRLASRTFAFLVGHNALAGDLVEFSSIEAPLVSLDQVVLPPEDKRRILSVVEHHGEFLRYRREWGFDDVIRYGRGVLMLFSGPPGTGKTMTAHGIARHMGKQVLNVDIPTFVDHREADHFLPALFREARLQDSLLFFDECEALFASRRHGNALMNVLLTEIERFEGVAILATNSPEALDPALDRRILVKVRFPEPDRDARNSIWKRHLPAQAPLADDVDVAALASQFEMAGGYIKNAVLTAVADAVHEGGSDPRITMAHLERAAKAQVPRASDGSLNLVYPTVRLADVFLPERVADGVAEVVDAARNRRIVFERWGIGSHLSYGKGVSALFFGPPGTGKTLCAEAIAGELCRPLLNATIPSLVSKWVGETEQRIESLFRNAKAQGAVLFLDEADALLAQRGTGHASRHDDSIVDVLLVNIERFDGVVLLATNLAERLDQALSRRLGWRLEFPVPDVRARAEIWGRLLPGTVPVDGALNLELLSRRHALTGGQIKNAVLRAAFRAARVDGALSYAASDFAASEESGADIQVRTVGFACK